MTVRSILYVHALETIWRIDLKLIRTGLGKSVLKLRFCLNERKLKT